MPQSETRRKSRRRRKKNLTADQLVADQIKALRGRRGISQQQLADTLGETQSTVARIESGQRTITVGELLRIAWALDVAPVHLLAASFEPQDIPIQNGLRLSPKDAREWVRGETPIPGGDHRSFYDNISEEEWAERQEIYSSLREQGSQAFQPSREELVESLALYREAEETFLETEGRGEEWLEKLSMIDRRLLIGSPRYPGALNEEGQRRKGLLEAAKRAKRRG